MRVLYDGGLLEHMTERESAEAMLDIMRALVRGNLAYLKRYPQTPHPYKSGVRYRRERSEHWKGIPAILGDRHGDCEDLASYLAAWYLAHGQRASIVLRWKVVRQGKTKRRLFHVMVRGPTGQIEDPSKVLGM